MVDLQRALERRLDARGAEDDCGRSGDMSVLGH